MIKLLKKRLHNGDYKILKGDIKKIRGGRTVVWSLDHSWNSLEWCLPGFFYMKAHYDVNLIFFASELGIWDRCQEEDRIYSLIQDIFDVIIINTVNISEYGYVKRKIWRLKKSLLKEQSLRYFFDEAKIDILVEMLNPTFVHEYFRHFHPETICITHEHSVFQQSLNTFSCGEVSLPDVDYYFCSDRALFNLVDDINKSKVIVIGAPQLDSWWIEYISKEAIFLLKDQLNDSKKTILVLLPAMLDDERLYGADKVALCRVLKEYLDDVNIVLKFHPRETHDVRMNFLKTICSDYMEKSIFITTINTECVSRFVDCVIVAGETSAAAGAIINDVPVIEFHSNAKLPTFYYENGVYGTLFLVKKLVIGAINYDSLKYAIDSVFISNLWDNYKNKYKEYIHHDNLASKRFAEFLMSL